MDEIDGYCLDEYEIAIHSWHDDFYSKRFKTADSFSEYRYKMEFKDKQQANQMWLWVIKTEPTYEQLEKAGFKKSIW
jgi:hypothetical protein